MATDRGPFSLSHPMGEGRGEGECATKLKIVFARVLSPVEIILCPAYRCETPTRCNGQSISGQDPPNCGCPELTTMSKGTVTWTIFSADAVKGLLKNTSDFGGSAAAASSSDGRTNHFRFIPVRGTDLFMFCIFMTSLLFCWLCCLTDGDNTL